MNMTRKPVGSAGDIINAGAEARRPNPKLDALARVAQGLPGEGDKAIQRYLVGQGKGDALRTAATPDRLSDENKEKVRNLFNDPEDGFKGYALDMNKGMRGDPEKRQQGDKEPPSEKEALAILLRSCTDEQMEEIGTNFTRPVIVMRPIVVFSETFVKDGENYKVGNTKFIVDDFGLNELKEEDKGNGIDSLAKTRIIGWEIGIADGAPQTKVLDTDGKVETKILEERIRDSDKKRDPIGVKRVSASLVALMLNKSRRDGTPIESRTWTPVGAVKDGLAAGVLWRSTFGQAYLREFNAYDLLERARLRFAVMFRVN